MNADRTMRVLELTGVVDANEMICDDRGLADSGTEGPSIGGTYVIEAFNETFSPSEYRSRPLTILLAYGGDKALYEGTAWAMEGDHGYSSVTPASSPDFWVGGSEGGRSEDFIEKLTELHGQTVHLRIDDGGEPA